MRRVEVLIVDGLEKACRQTRYLEWLPGWGRLYHCTLAKWSNQLDRRWSTGRWPIHSEEDEFGSDEEWETWFESLSDEEHQQGHWHAW